MTNDEHEGSNESEEEREQRDPTDTGGLEGEQQDKGYGADEGEREQALGND